MCDNRFELPQSHDGYIVTLNTLAKFYSDTRKDLCSYCDSFAKKSKDKNNTQFEEYNSHVQSFLTFGDFDRVGFTSVDRFSRYYDLNKVSKYWLGKHQNVFLYCIKNSNVRYNLYPYDKFNKDNLEHEYGFCVKDNQESNNSFCTSALTGDVSTVEGKNMPFFPFFLLTQISFSNEVVTRVKDYSEFLKTIKEQLSERLTQIIEGKGYEVYFEVYGCMNASEIAILWLCRQYSDVLVLIDYLKDYNIEYLEPSEENTDEINNNLFFSFYSIIGRTISNSLTDKSRINSLREFLPTKMARINITVSDKFSAQTLVNKLKEQFTEIEKYKIKHTNLLGGQYDLYFTIPIKNIYFQYAENLTTSPENGIFRNAEIREMILDIKTDLMTPVCDIGLGNANKQFDISDQLLSSGERRASQFNGLEKELSPDKADETALVRQYDKIREGLKEEFDSHTGSVDTLDMLYTDYLSNIHDTYNAIWRNDYHYQFKKSLCYLYELIKLKKKKDTPDFWEKYSVTIDNIRQQTTHFSQSGRLVMQIPASHLRYTASADRLFHSYYGVAKAILENAYKKQKGFRLYQSELLPIITTNSTPMITSELYHAGTRCDDLRILRIDIPYSLLFDPITGFPYLIHELFHYFTPINRSERNRIFFDMIVNETLATAYCDQILRGLRSYLYNLYLEEPEEVQKLGLKGSYDSSNSNSFIEDFQDVMEEVADGCPNPRIMNLKITLAHVMWNDKSIKTIRERIVDDILYDNKKHIRGMTLETALDKYKKTMDTLSISLKSAISERLMNQINDSEKRLAGANREDILKEFRISNMYIGCSNDPDDELNVLISRHKRRLLNPYDLGPICLNSFVNLAAQDIFIKGIREAIPDLAMAKYCELDSIEYLVTYARFRQDTFAELESDEYSNLRQDQRIGLIAEYDVIRLSLVLLWIGQYVNNGIGVEFDFESRTYDFVISYISEYMPHELEKSKEDAKGKIVSLIFTALEWHQRICDLVSKFNREYYLYFDKIKSIYDQYSWYFEGDNTDQFKYLIETVKERRRKKVEIRKGLLSYAQRYVLNEWIKKKNPLYDDFSSLKAEITKVGFLLPGIYEKTSREYDSETFRLILEFVHTSSNQKTLEAIGAIVYENSKNKKSKKKVYKKRKASAVNDSIDAIVKKTTEYMAWNLDGFSSKVTQYCDYLRRNDLGSPIWFKVVSSNDRVLPTALIEKQGGIAKHSLIYRDIQKSLQQFFNEREGKLDNVRHHEAVARMTIESPSYSSNYISWSGDLLTAFNEFTINNQVGSDAESIDLLLFSPSKYLRVRNEELQDIAGKGDILCFNSTTVETIYSEGITNTQQELYINGDNTPSLVVGDEIFISQKEDSVVAPNNYYKYYPVPINFISLGNAGRFLAYSLLTPIAIGNKNKELNEFLEIDVMQNQLLSRLIRRREEYKGKELQYTQDNAFIYRISIGKETYDEFNTLIGRRK